METEKLIDYVKARFDHAVAKKTLKEKYQAKLVFGWNGGMFRASPEMITFLSLYGNDQIVVQDLYETPIKVNAQELCNLMRARLQEQMNAWVVEYEELSQKR